MTTDLNLKSTPPSKGLFWMGIGLIGVFSSIVLAGIFPLGLLLPSWQQRVSNLILSNAYLAGIGAILILLAQHLDNYSEELEKWVGRLRLLAIPAAIGFFLLLPLQTYNGYRLVRIASGEDRQAIGQFQSILASIQSAQNEEALWAAVSQIPGAPPAIELNNINKPLPQLKEQISERIRVNIKKLENVADERNAKRWQASLISWARNCLISLWYGAGFAEVARLPKAPTSLLFSILSSLPWNRRMRSRYYK